MTRSPLTSNNSASTPMRTCTTSMRIFKHCVSAFVPLCLCVGLLIAQGPPQDSWPTYHGDFTGQRHSRLTEIKPDNINRLTKVWTFQTGQNQQIKATPILVNGVIYISTPDNLWAVDAHNGKELWHYKAPENNAFHIGHRGAAIYKDTVYLTTPDAHLIALNTKDGSVRWNVV